MSNPEYFEVGELIYMRSGSGMIDAVVLVVSRSSNAVGYYIDKPQEWMSVLTWVRSTGRTMLHTRFPAKVASSVFERPENE